jgi:hypothetical protein
VLEGSSNNRCNLSTSATRRLPHDNIHTEDDTPPPARHNKTSIASSLGADNPYINASAARKAAQESKIAANKKAAEKMRRASKIQEINCRQSELTELEVQYSTNHEMGNRKEELAASCSAKKGCSHDGQANLSSANATSIKYSSPTRVSKHSKKRAQVLSPAGHYTGCPSGDDNSTSVTEFLS